MINLFEDVIKNYFGLGYKSAEIEAIFQNTLNACMQEQSDFPLRDIVYIKYHDSDEGFFRIVSTVLVFDSNYYETAVKEIEENEIPENDRVFLGDYKNDLSQPAKNFLEEYLYYDSWYPLCQYSTPEDAKEGHKFFCEGYHFS